MLREGHDPRRWRLHHELGVLWLSWHWEGLFFKELQKEQYLNILITTVLGLTQLTGTQVCTCPPRNNQNSGPWDELNESDNFVTQPLHTVNLVGRQYNSVQTIGVHVHTRIRVQASNLAFSE